MNSRFITSLATAVLFFVFTSVGSSQDGFGFKPIVENDHSSVKSQDNTGTCWSYSTVSFMESELIRMGREEMDLSEMFHVRYIYEDKALNYVLRQGKARFSQGSLAHDVIRAINMHGMVPQEAYSGLEKGTERHDHSEMEKVLKAMVQAIVGTGKPSEFWEDAISSVLDTYLGEVPKTFSYKGKEYTPIEFRDALGINPDDYVSFTSFSHHPYYESFILEVPDNYSNGSFYNLPLDEFMELMNHALTEGYTIAWDADVSEDGFNWRKGIAVYTNESTDDLSEEDSERIFGLPYTEPAVSQKIRQTAFMNYETTDDHLMHITGMVKDKKGKVYYTVKNSWGTNRGGFDGFLYASEKYVQMKSISFLIHKDAVPADLTKQLGL